jgi:hypothetical protein
MTSRLSRRRLASLLLVTPALAQVTSTVPPQGSPAPAPASASPSEKLNKAIADVRSNSQQLSALEVPMNVEPAFSFKA